jgi:hypothetical protein
MCSDMQCAASKTTGNIYWCRGGTIATAFFAFALLILTLVYWTWMRAVHQLPWKYPRINQALDQVQSGAAVTLVSRARASQGACPVCHVATGKTYAPGAVCFWCDVARFAFVPFAVGLGCSVVAIVSLFSLSLRPSFADWYYTLILVLPYGVYVAFGAWVLLTQRPVHGDEDQRATTFVSLAMELRGRDLSSIFTLQSGGDAHEDGGHGAGSATSLVMDSGDSPNASMVSELDQHADTMQSLELDTEIPSNFREVLRETMRPDEFIAWAERPSSSVIIVDSRWLICSFGAGAVFGMFFLLIASIPTSSYPSALMAASTMRFAGFVILLLSFLMLAVTASSLQRQYVLTNKRIFFMSSGIFSSVHMSATELDQVSHASLHGYQELGYTVLTFAWGTATRPGRKMPVLQPPPFVGVVGVEELLSKFSEFCHNVDSSSQKATYDQRRTTWRIHLGALVGFAAIAPTMLVSPQILPPDLALFSLLWCWFMCATIAQRGWRILSTTSAHLNLAKEWGRFGGGFSLSRLVPGAIGRRMPGRKPQAVVRSVVEAQSPTAAAAKKNGATEL